MTNMTKIYYYTISQDTKSNIIVITKSIMIIVKWFKKLKLTPLRTSSIDIAMISVIKHLL